MRCTISLVVIFGLFSAGSILSVDISLPMKRSARPLGNYLDALFDYLRIDIGELGQAPGWVAQQVNDLSYVHFNTIARIESQVSGGDFSELKNAAMLREESTRTNTIRLLHQLSKNSFTDSPEECLLDAMKLIIRSLDSVIPIMDTFVQPRDAPVLRAKYETQQYQTFYTLCINRLSRLTSHCVNLIRPNFDQFNQTHQTSLNRIDRTISQSILHRLNRLRYVNKPAEKSMTLEASRLDDLPKRAAVDASISEGVLSDADRKEEPIEENVKLYLEEACSIIANETFPSIGVYNLAKAMEIKVDDQPSPLFNRVREYTRLCQNYILDERARIRGLL